jgi:hypothetical protein
MIAGIVGPRQPTRRRLFRAQAVWSVNANQPLGSVQRLGEIHRSSMARTSLMLVLPAHGRPAVTLWVGC